MIFTARQCADMANVTVRTIQRQIKSGKLSANRDTEGYYEIESSEFFRVYPDAKLCEQDGQKDKLSRDEIQTEIKYQLIEKELELAKREIEMLKKNLDKSEKRETDLIETLKSNTRLLENTQKRRKKFLGLF